VLIVQNCGAHNYSESTSARTHAALCCTRQEDDPLRAVRAAVSVRSGVEALADGVKCFVGVTTGMAFCGVIGSERRREYVA
jgi:class 3 adenylate cyclase